MQRAELLLTDLFCGIGGVAEAIRTEPYLRIGAAIDIDRQSNRVYVLNHGVQPQTRTLESIASLPPCDLLWLSPPCQPYTRRGKQCFESDRRSAALQHLIPLIARRRPRYLILENVPDFEGSLHHIQLTGLLTEEGYSISHQVLCPTQWNIPMRRRRFYLRASRDGLPISDVSIESTSRVLQDFVDERAWSDPTLRVDQEELSRYGKAIDVVNVDDPSAGTACFTSAYGKSPVRAGSYLRCDRRGQTRRFSPAEIATLMGFNEAFRWPEDVSQRRRYQMIGNALSVTVVKALLRSLFVEGGREC